MDYFLEIGAETMDEKKVIEECTFLIRGFSLSFLFFLELLVFFFSFNESQELFSLFFSSLACFCLLFSSFSLAEKK